MELLEQGEGQRATDQPQGLEGWAAELLQDQRKAFLVFLGGCGYSHKLRPVHAIGWQSQQLAVPGLVHGPQQAEAVALQLKTKRTAPIAGTQWGLLVGSGLDPQVAILVVLEGGGEGTFLQIAATDCSKKVKRLSQGIIFQNRLVRLGPFAVLFDA